MLTDWLVEVHNSDFNFCFCSAVNNKLRLITLRGGKGTAAPGV